jgi:hypothetical protein
MTSDSLIKFSPIAIGIAALIVSYYNNKNTIDQQKRLAKIQEIEKKLNEFYGPLLQLRMKSNALYAKFSEKFRAIDADFATLTYLLSGKTFTGNDEVLLKEIIKLGKASEQLIHDKAGLIDDEELRKDIIPKATTHFLLLRLAYKNILIGEPTAYKDSTFPRELDVKLEKRNKSLMQELQDLNAKKSWSDQD